MKGSLKNIPILVTGGAGFIGSHLVDALVAQEARVTIVDNFSTGSMENLAQSSACIEIIKGDITDASLMMKITHKKQIVFHLAAQTSVPASCADPLSCYTTNIQGTYTLLEACKLNNVCRFIFSSSAAVYGNHEGVCREDQECKPASPYGLSKLMGENLCRFYTQTSDLKTMCLRYFNVYGPRQNGALPQAGFVARIRHQIGHNQPITIYGDGQQTRDFVSVADVVRANSAAALVDESLVKGQTLNVGTGKSISLLALIEDMIKQFPDYRIPPHFLPARQGDILHSRADCKALQLLYRAHNWDHML